MKNLYLVQHGEAKPKEEDPDRPLTDRGKADVLRVSLKLKTTGSPVDRIVHSGKTRAHQTAAIIALALGRPDGVAPAAGINPDDDPALFRDQLISFSGENLMIVGHQPFLGRLAALLVTGDARKDIVRFQTGCVLALVSEDGAWKIGWMIVPGTDAG